jgi:heavy metal sensor kinase
MCFHLTKYFPQRRVEKTSGDRLLLLLVSFLAGVFLIFGAMAYLLARQSLLGDLDQFVLDKALLLGRNMNPQNPAWIRYEEREWRSQRFTPIGQAFDPDWQRVFTSVRLSAPIEPTAQVREQALHPGGVVIGNATGRDGERYRMATVSVRRDDELIGFAQIAVPLREWNQELRRLLFWLLGSGLLALMGATAAASYMLHQWRAPLSMLLETASKLSVQNLSRQRLFSPPDFPELEQLARAFNELLDQLEAAHKNQDRFIADASHEMRTPLTILQGEIEVTLRRERKGPEYRATLKSCLEEIHRLTRLAENLLALARVGAGAHQARVPVDLAMLCREISDQLAPLAEGKQVALQVDASTEVEILGDRFALERVVFNLVENAIRYSPPGESVAIRAERSRNEAKIIVADSGVGIPPEDLPRIFDRFYRVDPARAQTAGGAGLGLALVKALVEAHGGKVEARSRVGKGSEFTVLFDLAARSLPA